MSPPNLAHRRRISGQSKTEFIIIVFLVAIGTIAIVTLYGNQLRNLFGSSAGNLAGNTRVIPGGGLSPNPNFTMKGRAPDPSCGETGYCTLP
jgi:Flp pilus assembly pilin Flp